MATAGPIRRVVGALACQKDSYLKSLTTEVLSCQEYVPQQAPPSTGKSKTKKSTDPQKVFDNANLTISKTYLIEFADSVLFPEGGGQLTDHGNITPGDLPTSESIPITNVQRHGMHCVAFSPKPLDPGTSVQQTVDFKRRWDLMQQHTGQHLLSAIMDNMNLETLGWSMGTPGQMNYVDIPRKPDDAEMRAIQDRCNEIIRQDLPITVETPADAKAESLPEDYDKDKGVVRFIKIGDLDYNACCGTHLQQTSHINLILLHHTQTIRGTKCRLYFTAGDRAIDLATTSINSMRSMAMSLSIAPSQLEDRIQQIDQSLSDSRRNNTKLLAEIAKYEGQRIKDILAQGRTAFCHRAVDGAEFISLVSSEVRDAVKGQGAVVFASGQDKTAGSILIIGGKDLVDELVSQVKTIVSSVKGGGKGERWSGKVVLWNKGEIEALRKLVEG